MTTETLDRLLQNAIKTYLPAKRSPAEEVLKVQAYKLIQYIQKNPLVAKALGHPYRRSQFKSIALPCVDNSASASAYAGASASAYASASATPPAPTKKRKANDDLITRSPRKHSKHENKFPFKTPVRVGLRPSTSWTGTIITRRPVNLDAEQCYKVEPSSRNKGNIYDFCQGLLSAVPGLESEDDKSDDKDSGAERGAEGGERDDNQTPDRKDLSTSDDDDLGGGLGEFEDLFDCDFSYKDFLNCFALEVYLRGSRIQSPVSESAEAMLRSANSVRAAAAPSSPRDASRPEPDSPEHHGWSLHNDAPNAGQALHRVSEPQEVNRGNKNAPSAVAAPNFFEHLIKTSHTRHRTKRSELKTLSRDGYLQVFKNEYKLHARRSFYRIAFTTYAATRPMTDLKNQLEVWLTKHDGHTVKFTQQQAGHLPWFSINKLDRAPLRGTFVQKWHLKLHDFRTHWNRAWSGMTCAWLKISVAEDCYIRIKITYDREKRRKSKTIYKNKQRKKKIKADFDANTHTPVSNDDDCLSIINGFCDSFDFSDDDDRA